MGESQRVAIVTGAAGGIGRALVKGLLGAGIRVAVHTRVTVESRATVVYSHAHSVGLTFRDVKPQSLTVLRRLLVTAMQKQQEREEAGESS